MTIRDETKKRKNKNETGEIKFKVYLITGGAIPQIRAARIKAK
jgi:hypothetical protein